LRLEAKIAWRKFDPVNCALLKFLKLNQEQLLKEVLFLLKCARNTLG
jgi:hypothetical protein